jgi:hypothetical protein
LVHIADIVIGIENSDSNWEHLQDGAQFGFERPLIRLDLHMCRDVAVHAHVANDRTLSGIEGVRRSINNYFTASAGMLDE